MTEASKTVCTDCGWKGMTDQLLTAPSPFEPMDTLYGCPACKSVNAHRNACFRDGCWQDVTCGTPTDDCGYVFTCSQHQPPNHSNALQL